MNNRFNIQNADVRKFILLKYNRFKFDILAHVKTWPKKKKMPSGVMYMIEED